MPGMDAVRSRYERQRAARLYVEPGEPADPARDQRAAVNIYAVAVSPADGAVWGTVVGYPGSIVRVTPGRESRGDRDFGGIRRTGARLRSARRRRRPQRCTGCHWPAGTSASSIDAGASASRTDRDRRPLPRGWTLHRLPGPQLRDVDDSGERRGELLHLGGLVRHVRHGSNVPIVMGNLSDSILAFVNGSFVTLRIPYPSGFFRRTLTDASTIPAPAGRARGCGPPPAPGRCSTSKEGRRTGRRQHGFQLRSKTVANRIDR